jgi:arylformamidase
MRLLDISPPLHPGLATWPGDATFREAWTFRIGPGCPVNVGELACSTHTGSHVDAPLHYAENGTPVGELPLDVFIGPCRVVHAMRARGVVRLDDLPAVTAERLLIRTRERSDPDVWDSGFTAIDAALIEELAGRGLRLVGTDAPSVDPETSKTLDAHRMAHRHGVLILEGLVLDEVPEGAWELIALPLRLAGLDASPVRAVLRGPL